MNRLKFTLTFLAVLGWYQYYLSLVKEGNTNGYFLIFAIISVSVWRLSGYMVKNGK